MLRSIIVFVIMLIGPLVLLMMPPSVNPLAYYGIYLSEEFYDSSYRPPLQLLESQLVELSPKEQQALMSDVKPQFAHDIELIDITNLKASDEVIPDRDFSFVFGDPGVFYYRFKNGKQALKLAIDHGSAQDFADLFYGPLILFKNKLDNLNPSEQLLLVESIASEYQQNYQIIDPVAFNKANFSKTKFNDIWYSQDFAINSTYAVPLANNNWLTVEDHYIGKVDNHVIIGSVIYIVVGMALSLAAWFYPLIRDLRKLATTAEKFGEGNFDVKAKVSFISAVNKLAKTFNLMSNGIEKSVKTQQQLTHAISQDLRNPLHRLQFAYQMFSAEKNFRQDKEKYVAVIEKNIDELDRIIDQTLLLSRYNRVADRSQKKQVNILSKVCSQIEKSIEQYPKIDIVLKVENLTQDTELLLDDKGIQRALNGLLTYSCRSAKQEVQVLTALDKDSLNIHVSSDGYFDKSRESIFEPVVHQESELASKSDSLIQGMDLAIAKAIAHWHEGSVSVSQCPNLKGTRLTVQLPLLCD